MSRRERLRAIGRVGIAGGLLLLIANLALTRQNDPDLFWHLLVAEKTSVLGGPPSSDLLSWWSGGTPWVAHEWLGELLLLGAFRVGGFPATSLLFLPAWALLVGAVVGAARARFGRLSPAALLAVVAVLVLGADFVWSPRLQIVDAAGAALLLWALEQDRAGRAGGTRSRALLAPLLFAPLWANLHGGGVMLGPALGLLWLAGGAFEALEAGPPRARRRALGALRRPALALMAMSGLFALNPAGLELYTYPFATILSSAQRDLIGEWQGLDFALLNRYALRALLAFGVALAFASPALRRDRRALLAIGALVFLTLASGRYAGPLAVVLAIYTAVPLWATLRRALARALPRPARRPAFALAPFAILFFALPFALVALSGFAASLREPARPVEGFPTRALERIGAAAGCGRVWNEYGWGGYLAWAARIPVAGYGAADALGDARIRTVGDLSFLRTDPGIFLDAERVDWAIIETDRPLAQWFAIAPAWRIAVRDETALVAVRRHSRCDAEIPPER